MEAMYTAFVMVMAMLLVTELKSYREILMMY